MLTQILPKLIHQRPDRRHKLFKLLRAPVRDENPLHNIPLLVLLLLSHMRQREPPTPQIALLRRPQHHHANHQPTSLRRRARKQILIRPRLHSGLHVADVIQEAFIARRVFEEFEFAADVGQAVDEGGGGAPFGAGGASGVGGQREAGEERADEGRVGQGVEAVLLRALSVFGCWETDVWSRRVLSDVLRARLSAGIWGARMLLRLLGRGGLLLF